MSRFQTKSGLFTSEFLIFDFQHISTDNEVCRGRVIFMDLVNSGIINENSKWTIIIEREMKWLVLVLA